MWESRAFENQPDGRYVELRGYRAKKDSQIHIFLQEHSLNYIHSEVILFCYLQLYKQTLDHFSNATLFGFLIREQCNNDSILEVEKSGKRSWKQMGETTYFSGTRFTESDEKWNRIDIQCVTQLLIGGLSELSK